MTKEPKFSILIPTRDRPDTLRHALASVINQYGSDYEIVIADNFSGPGVAQVISDFDYSKIRHFRTEKVLPMTENWEFGLDKCIGEYVTILGDDDAFMPSTLEIARSLINQLSPEILHWKTHTYWWPDTIAFWNKNRLIVNLESGMYWYGSSSLLEMFYRDEISFDQLPMIYSSFVSRKCIIKAKDKYGKYFSVPNVPDVVSGILNLTLADKILFSARPLSVRGNSGKSTGTAQWARSLGEKQRMEYHKNEGASLSQIIHPNLIPSPNLEILLASVKLKCKEIYFSDRADLDVSIPTVIKKMISGLNFDPDSYDDNLSEILQLATKHNLAIRPDEIPPKALDSKKNRIQGPIYDHENKLKSLVVNCDTAGVGDVCAAAAVAEAIQAPFR